jgi:hypothetical protein
MANFIQNTGTCVLQVLMHSLHNYCFRFGNEWPDAEILREGPEWTCAPPTCVQSHHGDQPAPPLRPHSSWKYCELAICLSSLSTKDFGSNVDWKTFMSMTGLLYPMLRIKTKQRNTTQSSKHRRYTQALMNFTRHPSKFLLLLGNCPSVCERLWVSSRIGFLVLYVGSITVLVLLLAVLRLFLFPSSPQVIIFPRKKPNSPQHPSHPHQMPARPCSRQAFL